MAVAPAFQFYYKDWLVSTTSLSLADRGAYITLLCHQWDKGGFRARDVPQLLAGALPTQCAGIWKRLQRRFPRCADGLRRNTRLEAVRAEQQAYREAQTLKGQQGARVRWHGRGNAQAKPGQWPNDGSASASASASAKDKDFASGGKPKVKTVATADGFRVRLAVVPVDDPRPAV